MELNRALERDTMHCVVTTPLRALEHRAEVFAGPPGAAPVDGLPRWSLGNSKNLAVLQYLCNSTLIHRLCNMPASPSTQEKAVLALAGQRPLLRARDLAEKGLPTVLLSRLVATGRLERVSRGIYSLPGRRPSEHRSLAEASLRVPRGVICLLSALRVHGIGTQAPFEVWMAIPNHFPAPRVEQPALRIVRMTGAPLIEGIHKLEVDGVPVPVFCAAKTVVDCFKHRNKIGLDVALEALKDGWAQGQLSMDELWHFASVDRVLRVMRPYLESISS